MRKYIAFHNSESSGIVTREKAIDWATDLMTRKNLLKVHLCEVTEVIERNAPPVVLRSYLPPTEESSQPLAKAKASLDF
jgi:hypothetical protein